MQPGTTSPAIELNEIGKSTGYGLQVQHLEHKFWTQHVNYHLVYSTELHERAPLGVLVPGGKSCLDALRACRSDEPQCVAAAGVGVFRPGEGTGKRSTMSTEHSLTGGLGSTDFSELEQVNSPTADGQSAALPCCSPALSSNQCAGKKCSSG